MRMFRKERLELLLVAGFCVVGPFPDVLLVLGANADGDLDCRC